LRLLVAELGLAAGEPDGKPAPARQAVLDCGGGSGSLAVPLAELGAEVTVVDASVDALATLSRRAAEAGVADRVRPVQGDVESLADVVPTAAFDLVLAHDLLNSVEQPADAVAGLAAAVRPGGAVSIVTANPVAAVLSRVLAGELEAARALLRIQLDESGPAELDLAGLHQLCARFELAVVRIQGIGVFAELMPGGELAASPGTGELLAELESMTSAISPYRDIALRLHLLARRPAGAGGLGAIARHGTPD
jgi:S-adenosylmethionine-dependent methyltransferase